MLDPFNLLPSPAFWPAWIASCSALVFFWGMQFYLGRRLFNATATNGIVSLELAGTSRQAEDVLESWDASARYDAVRSVRWDFGFVVTYALALAHGCTWASSAVVLRWDWARWVGMMVVAVVWVAALCDVVENFALLAMLRDGASMLRAAVASRSAVAKFSLIGVATVFLALGVVAWFPTLSVIVHYASTHLGFVLIVSLVYGIVFGLVGTGFGIPSLYWHDDPFIRVSASSR